MNQDEKLKQSPGAMQGNIHRGSDEGRNQKGHAGSTIHQTEDHPIENSGEREEVPGAESTSPRGGRDQDGDTIGNP